MFHLLGRLASQILLPFVLLTATSSAMGWVVEKVETALARHAASSPTLGAFEWKLSVIFKGNAQCLR